MDPGRLIAARIRCDDIPIEQRERLVETGNAVEVRRQSVGPTAVAVANKGIDQRNPDLVCVPDAILVIVNESASVDIRLPLLGANLPHLEVGNAAGAGGRGRRGDAAHVGRRREAINDLVIPLVAEGQSPVAAGNAGKLEVPVGVALGEHEVFRVRVSQAHPALRPSEGIARAAGVESLVRCPAQALDIHLPFNDVGARADSTEGAGTDRIVAVIDDLRIDKANAHVVAGRSVLLEVAGLPNADERIVGMLSIQSVGLEPFFPARNPVSPRVGLDAEFVRHEIGNHRLACQRR